MNSKRADISGEKFLLYFCYAILIPVGLALFVGTISSISGRTAIVPRGVENTFIVQRVFTSPYCFAYQDNTGRSYDMIDFDKFSNKTLETCLALDEYPYDFRFELRISEVEIVQEHLEGSRHEINTVVENTYRAYTQDWFGSSFEESYTMPVLVKNNNKLITGRIVVSRQISGRRYS